MKFKYYIVSTEEGKVYGTNNDKIAAQYSQDETYFVIEGETGTWIDNGAENNIPQIGQE